MINNRYVLTAAEMLAAEQVLIDDGASIETLMERAGQGAAQEIWRVSHDMPTLVLCGPGNNGGDGYVIAEWLRQKGVKVSVATAASPKTNAALDAHSRWKGKTVPIGETSGSAQIVDCLFGTGLQRPITGELLEHYLDLCRKAQKLVAIDLPSGINSDTGEVLNEVPEFDMTIALGAYKPAHFMEPARSYCGQIQGVDIGIDTASKLRVNTRPEISIPKAFDHKYSRGLVAIVAGEMHGAAKLSALAAQASGAGYVKIFAAEDFDPPHPSIVVNRFNNPKEFSNLLGDDRISAVAIGPGLGRLDSAKGLVEQVLAWEGNLVLDADAITLLGSNFASKTKGRKHVTVATPHAGEFGAIYDGSYHSKIDDTIQLAKAANSTILHKGSDTVISDPGGKTALSNLSNSWLSTAGTGDVLTGIIAARLANGVESFEAAKQGQWLHSRAAQLAGPSFSPETLIRFLPQAMAECL